MITTSDAWKEYAKNNFIYHIKAVLTPSSGSALNLTDEDFMMGTVRFNDSTSDSNTFTIGGVITNTFEGTLNNTEGKFDNFNFDGATISVQVGIEYEDSTSEYINRGVYTVDKPSTMGSTIQLTCYDYMDKLNVYYIGQRQNGSTITFPIQAQTLAQYLCEYCEVTWGSWSLGSFTVNEFEYDESTTCRQVLGWILQCVGGFAKMSPTGTIQCKWYDAKFWSNAIDMDGGVFNPWQTAGNLDGGTMWVAVPTYSGGTMLDGASWEFTQVSRINVGVVDIEITGVRAYANGTVDEFEFETVGSDGYIIALSDNPLITSSNMQTVATNVYNQCQGLHFRIFDASVWASPNMEAGDSCLIQDYRGNVYPSIVTNMNYTLNGLCDVECNAETPGENSLETANPTTQTIAGATRAAYDYISAKKLDADTIGFGILQSNDSPPSFYLNLDTGQLNINATSLYENSNAVASESYADGVASTAESNAKAYADTQLSTLESDLESQIDAKVETWVQATAPSTSWTTTALKTAHNGDLWYYTGTSNLTVNSVTIEPSKTYQYNASTNKWVAYDNPSTSLFDYADGKSTIYYGATSDTFSGVETGDYLVDSTMGTTYRWTGSSWSPLIATNVVNLVPSVYYREAASGDTWVNNGITWTVNPDGSVTANGTATATSNYLLSATVLTNDVPVVTLDPTKRYRFSGCPSGGSSSTYRMRARITPDGTTPSGSSGSVVNDNGNGVTFSAGIKYAALYISITNGYTASDLTFYPMLEVGTTSSNYVSSHTPTESLISNYDTALNQTKVFNKLTNNGALQGLYMSGGDMYINCTYIKSGTLSLGGVNNEDGVLQILNSSSDVVGEWDNTGITAIAGNIGDWTLANGQLSSVDGNYTNTLSASEIETKEHLTSQIGDVNRITRLKQGDLQFRSYNNTTSTDQVLLIIGPAYDSSNNPYASFAVYKGIYYLPGAGGTVAYRYGGAAGQGSYSSMHYFSGAVRCANSFTVNGTKSRAVETEDYAERLLYAYETPSPMFGDVGEGEIGEDGLCYVWLEPIFAETIDKNQYQVFLQKYGDGDCYVKERTSSYFIVEGTIGLNFGWEIKAKQIDYSQRRLDKHIDNEQPLSIIGEETANYINELREGRIST